MTTTPPAPTVTVITTADPTPRVELEVAPMPSDAWTFTIWRITPTTRFAVRGAVAALAASPIVVDYEAPFGVPVTYQVQTWDVDGVPSELGPASAPVTLDVDDLWLSDPLDASTALMIRMCPPMPPDTFWLTSESMHDLVLAIEATVHVVAGNRLPVGIGRVRRLWSAIPWQIICPTPGDAANLRELMLNAFPVLARIPARGSYPAGALYMAALDVHEAPTWKGQTTFTFQADTVRPPGASMVIFPRVWDDIPDEAATWDQVAQLFATWNDVARGSQTAGGIAA